MGRMPQMRKHIYWGREQQQKKVEKVKNAVFEERKTGQKEEAGNCDTLTNTSSCFYCLSYWECKLLQSHIT